MVTGTRRRAAVKNYGRLSARVAAITARPALADLPHYDRVRVLDAPRQIGDAELIDQDGNAVRLSDLRGKVAFVLFGFTNCPDVCPSEWSGCASCTTRKRSTPKRAYVMISVDGERDTPAAMKAFLSKYSEEFIGLTAPPSKVKPIAAEFSAAFYKGHVGHDGAYDVAHSPQIFVLDTKGQLRAELYGASLDAMAGVAVALGASDD